MSDCTPQGLARAAACFQCLPDGAIRPVKTNLLCQWGRTPLFQCSDPMVVDWLARIAAGGAPRPSNNTVQAVCNFCTALRTAGLQDVPFAINLVIPDSLDAMLYPLFSDVGPIGISPWLNNGFVAADLNNDGLIGDGVSKYINTGIVPAGGDKSLVVYESEAHHLAVPVVQEIDLGVYGFDFGIGVDLQTSLTSYDETFFAGAGKAWSTDDDLGSGQPQFLQADTPGFYGTSLGNNSLLWYGSTGTGFVLRDNILTTPSTAPAPGTIYAFALHEFIPSIAVDNPNWFSSKRISFFWVSNYFLNAAQMEDLFDAVQILRAALGGGFV